MKIDAQIWQLAAIVFALIGGFGVGLSEQKTDWHAYAQSYVDARNSALVAGDWQSLATLTVDGSPARAQDEELRAWMEAHEVKLEAISTLVINAELLDRKGPVLAVTSYQSGAHILGSDSANEGERMCRHWHMHEGQIYSVTPCAEKR